MFKKKKQEGNEKHRFYSLTEYYTKTKKYTKPLHKLNTIWEIYIQKKEPKSIHFFVWKYRLHVLIQYEKTHWLGIEFVLLLEPNMDCRL